MTDLPADQQAELKRLFGDDLLDYLQSAGKAADLKLLTSDEYLQERNLAPEAAGKLRNLQFLQYAEDGKEVTIGVDPNNSLVGFLATTNPATGEAE